MEQRHIQPALISSLQSNAVNIRRQPISPSVLSNNLGSG
jgi:hypothetical protein